MSHHHQPTLTAFFQARRRPVDTQAAKRRKICAEDTLAQQDDAQVLSTYDYEHSLLTCGTAVKDLPKCLNLYESFQSALKLLLTR
jgi:hypothetical protein